MLVQLSSLFLTVRLYAGAVTHLRILLLGSDPLVRAGLAQMLAANEQFAVADQQDGQGDWQTQVDLHRCDIVVCDVGWEGAMALPDLDDLSVPVLVLTPDGDSADSAWQADAQGVVGRAVSAEKLEQAIRALYAGLSIFDPDQLPTRLERNSHLIGGLADPLTERETEVLTLLARGLTNRAIAFELEISDHTVKFHVNALLAKLQAQSRTEAAVRATRLGLISI